MAPFNMEIPTLAIPGDKNQNQPIELQQQASIHSPDFAAIDKIFNMLKY